MRSRRGGPASSNFEASATPRRRFLFGTLLGIVSVGQAQARNDIAAEWLQLKARIRNRYPQVRQLTVPELLTWLDDPARPRPVLLDVRSEAEFMEGHLKSAIRTESLDEAHAALKPYSSDTPVVLYCSVGMRSSRLASGLMAGGRSMLWNLEGSVFEWANAGHPLVKAQGPTRHVHAYDSDWGRFLQKELWSRRP